MNDNIVAFWVPDQLPKPGMPINFDYRTSWGKEAQQHCRRCRG
jgi:glucans biosynthesis protein